jgi:hypothetical protein
MRDILVYSGFDYFLKNYYQLVQLTVGKSYSSSNPNKTHSKNSRVQVDPQSHGKLMYTDTNNGHSCAQDDTNNCAICLSQVEHGACTRLPCGHAFHSHCITQWEGYRRNPTLTLAVTCPLCRKPYTPSFGGVINHVAVARNLIHDFDMSTLTPYVQRALTSNTRQVGGLISTWR